MSRHMVLDHALSYLDAGISVVPVARDGSKRPCVAWKAYQSELPDWVEAREWWSAPRPPGIAAVCGKVSGGLELIDFDRNAEVNFLQWCVAVEEASPGLLWRLCIVRTPRQPFGIHVWMRSFGDVPGNAKLAIDPAAPGKERCLIETRGEGGYALVPGCPLDCHETRRRYIHVAGKRLEELVPIEKAERDVLIRCARALSREPVPASAPKKRTPFAPTIAEPGVRVGDDFDNRGPDWLDILGPFGWTCIRTRSGVREWCRPGKEQRGVSATTGFYRKGEMEWLYIFSTNAHPFEDRRAYTKFHAYTLLAHAGDFRATAKSLAEQGYGTPRAR